METQVQIVQRWRDLREGLLEQLGLLESGVLSAHSNDMDVAPPRVDELKREILQFDELIASTLASTPRT